MIEKIMVSKGRGYLMRGMTLPSKKLLSALSVVNHR